MLMPHFCAVISGGIVLHHRCTGSKVCGVVLNKFRAIVAPVQEQIGNAIEQINVGAGTNCQMHIRDLGGWSTTGIDDDEFDVGMAFVMLAEAIKENRMAFCGIAANNEGTIGEIQIVVAAGGAIGPKTLDIARYRRGHTQAGVGIKVIGAETALHQLLSGVVVLGDELSRAIHTKGIGSLSLLDGTDAIADVFQSSLPTHPLKRLIQPLPEHGMEELVFAHGLRHGCPFDTHHAMAGGMGAIAAHDPGMRSSVWGS